MHEYGSFDCKPKIAVDLDNKEKPFKLLNNVAYLSGNYTDKDIYRIEIHKGYNWNGANIPRPCWSLIGYSQYSPDVLPASMVHDWLCEHKDFIIKNGVKISSDIFRDVLLLYGVPRRKANLMANCVRIFQKFQRGWN